MIVSLDKGWELRDAPLTWGVGEAAQILSRKNCILETGGGTGTGWMKTDLPCDVHMPLMENGIIKDPVKADYCFESEWIEKRSWWFLREIGSDEIDRGCDLVELEIDSLDAEADVFFNGIHLGRHRSAHYPFIHDVKPYVTDGKNTLLVRVTSGLEHVTEEDVAQLGWAVACESDAHKGLRRGDKRRSFVRKPQYVYGWDWSPRIATVGIMKGARINCCNRIEVRGSSLSVISVELPAKIKAVVEVENLRFFETIDTGVKVEMFFGGERSAAAEKNDILMVSGMNYVELELDVPDARLWWPNGMGEQPLYDVKITAASGGFESISELKFGIRTIEPDTSRIDGENRWFRFFVNGKPLMCKGGDWISADAVYARVTDEKYDKLIREAKAAHFTMLRVWGGGIYERDAFFKACDRYGILIWQDFMFSCSIYPDHLDWFQREVEKEIDYQTRRLRNHASLALWCGNNENQWIYRDLSRSKLAYSRNKSYGLTIYNQIAPAIVRKNCAHIPYWSSSPYGGSEPNANEVGDRHHWGDCMMNREMEKRVTPEEYDQITAKFISEYGYPGPCPLKSIEEYFDGKPVDRESGVWELHNNTFEKHTVKAGIQKHYTERSLDLPEYILYASMVQSLMLNYSLEAIRSKPQCSGALFWMYNDCWGEVGWTIIDYYLRRKPSFYGVKRAFEPVKLILRKNGDQAAVTGCNDTAEEITFRAQAGWFPLDGSARRTEEVAIVIPAFFRGVVLELPVAEGDARKEVWALKPDGETVRPAVLRQNSFKGLDLPESKINAEMVGADAGGVLVRVSADNYCHGVHFGLENAVPEDEYFDLLPGESRTVRIEGLAADEFEGMTIKTVL
ncbi:MAG TPA: beta-mannosidase [Clostridiales bacterium]|nr:beta-mannosidase [Clostridiales bacterium]